MKKNIKVIVNGKPYEVEVENYGAANMAVTVNGQAYEVAVEADESIAPVVAAVQPTASAPVRATPARSAAPVTGASGNTLVAPMPGVVLDIMVKPGDKVAYGQQLCALEAMKMKNAIRAPREVTIASVEVYEGQQVNYSEVLFKFSA
jgi:biotin carboxyl carrier protein